MKELLDKYLERRTKDFITYKKKLDIKLKEFNDKVGSLKEGGLEIEEIGKKLEEENFYLILLRDDFQKLATELDVIVEIYKRTNQELPKEYKDLVKEIPEYKEGNRLDLFTFVVDGNEIKEKEKGIIKTKLELTKKSEVYKKFNP